MERQSNHKGDSRKYKDDDRKYRDNNDGDRGQRHYRRRFDDYDRDRSRRYFEQSTSHFREKSQEPRLHTDRAIPLSPPHEQQADISTRVQVNVPLHPLLRPEIKAEDLHRAATGSSNVRPFSSTSNRRTGASLLERVTTMPTSKASKVDAFLAIKPPSIHKHKSKANPFYDPRLPDGRKSTVKASRPMPISYTPGQLIEEAERLRERAELEALRREVSEGLSAAGIDVDVVKDILLPLNNQKSAVLPKVEWWDLPFSQAQADNAIEGLITNLVQRPALLPPPKSGLESVSVAPLPLYLTSAERKKLRRQRRLADHREKQEKIKLGLLPPEPPCLRLTTLQRVLVGGHSGVAGTTEAITEPSRIEAAVREAAAQRHQQHLQANEERSQIAREKRATTNTTIRSEGGPLEVSVYRIECLEISQWRFKVTRNAQQLDLTGVVIFRTHPNWNLVIVEGKPADQRRYRHLLLERIQWRNPPLDSPKSTSELDFIRTTNQCRLVWEGPIDRRHFRGPLRGMDMGSEVDVLEYLERHSMAQYWQLAKNLL